MVAGDAGRPCGAPPTWTGIAPTIAPAGALKTGDVAAVGGAGSWSGATGFLYQWQLCEPGCTNIPGANDDVFPTTGAMAGKQLRLAVRATNSDGTSAAHNSAPSSVNANPGTPPQSTGPPSLSPLTAQPVGTTFTATAGSFATAPVFYQYRWMRCTPAGNHCRLITTMSGGATSTYTATAADAGVRLKAYVTGANASGGDTRATAVTEAVQPAPVSDPGPGPGTPSPAPPAAASPAPAQQPVVTVGVRRIAAPAIRRGARVRGRARVGRVLRIATGTWTGAPAFRFQWLRNGKRIRGATKRTYRVRRGDRRRRIACQITAVNSGGRATFTTDAVRVR